MRIRLNVKLFLSAGLLALAADPSYVRDVEQYRAHREASLKQDDSWLSVAGLFRLKEGENRVGRGEPNEIALPSAAPEHLGKITFSNGKAVYYTEGAAGMELKPNTDIIRTGRISFFVIQRGAESFVRVKDNDSQIRREFTGLKWFPIDPSWNITAKFTPYGQPRTICSTAKTRSSSQWRARAMSPSRTAERNTAWSRCWKASSCFLCSAMAPATNPRTARPGSFTRLP